MCQFCRYKQDGRLDGSPRTARDWLHVTNMAAVPMSTGEGLLTLDYSCGNQS
jgi:hypothetical protein